MKRRATSSIIHAGMSLKFWFWAACQAAYMYRVQALGIQMPEGVPTSGHSRKMWNTLGQS
eukprot:7570815-Prorocentrum_lima.AAC.1